MPALPSTVMAPDARIVSPASSRTSPPEVPAASTTLPASSVRSPLANRTMLPSSPTETLSARTSPEWVRVPAKARTAPRSARRAPRLMISFSGEATSNSMSGVSRLRMRTRSPAARTREPSSVWTMPLFSMSEATKKTLPPRVAR